MNSSQHLFSLPAHSILKSHLLVHSVDHWQISSFNLTHILTHTSVYTLTIVRLTNSNSATLTESLHQSVGSSWNFEHNPFFFLEKVEQDNGYNTAEAELLSPQAGDLGASLVPHSHSVSLFLVFAALPLHVSTDTKSVDLTSAHSHGSCWWCCLPHHPRCFLQEPCSGHSLLPSRDRYTEDQ